MAGLVVGRQHGLPVPPLALAVAAVVSATLSLARPRNVPWLWAPALVLAMTLSGAALYELNRARLPAWDALPVREVRVTLELDRVFPPHPHAKSVTGLAHLLATDAHLTELVGQTVYFSIALSPGETPPLRSSRVGVTGVLQTLPRLPANDTFDGYLANQGVNYKLTRARASGAVTPATAYSRFCDTTLRSFDAFLSRGVESYPAQVGVLRAMLLGQQQELSAEQTWVFRASGTMHLFSVSGLHIAVIAAAIQGILLVTRMPVAARIGIGGVLLWLYVDITGGTPSAVRAFLMVIFIQAAEVLRRPGNPVAALIGSAVCVLVIHPLQLFSASFQLSYGIVLALLLLGLPLGEYWIENTAPFTRLPSVTWRWWHRWIDWCWRWLLGVLGIGLATSLVSLISGVVIFKLLTPVAIFANLVLIPLGSLVIISGFLSLLGGLVGFGYMVRLFNHASVLLLKLSEWGVHRFTEVPGAFQAAEFINEAMGYPVLAGLMAGLMWGYANNWTGKRGGFWVPFVFTALILATCLQRVAAVAGKN
ncbi:MAG: ComEC/Rec2 family competence protein [Opitutus sp.]|nr:ComEC/Rec2 family competence protein [Opitutus sp.]MCS6247402.1 ComEC/Rec2 family competence protein [Opitutus sp.]MCS6275555.1 ComEC/Rec2 family competence protein [Opitutus sp.]MCS6278445.1 ComEC/Rec2 family competence protein [Opitutus sp.]MCS6300152.1 ComEC/Rec2 family competence protein [Opitutus sp.]